MNRKIISRIIISFLFLVGMILILSSQKGITGASVQSYLSSDKISVIGLSILIIAVVTLINGNLEDKIKKYDPNVKSLRRWLEKKERRKIMYEEAEQLYKLVEKEYWEAVNKGLIKQEHEKPLKFIEDYIRINKTSILEEVFSDSTSIKYLEKHRHTPS